jgi:hypothetical protein
VVLGYLASKVEEKALVDAAKSGVKVNVIEDNSLVGSKTWKPVTHPTALGIILSFPDDWSVFDVDFPSPLGLGQTILVASYPKAESIQAVSTSPYLMAVSVASGLGGNGVGDVRELEKVLAQDPSVKVSSNQTQDSLDLSGKKAARINFTNTVTGGETYPKSLVVIDSDKDLLFFLIAYPPSALKLSQSLRGERDHNPEIESILNTLIF